MLILSEADAVAFDARLRQALETGNISDLVAPNGKRFGECTKGDIRELAEAYERLVVVDRAKAELAREQLERSLRPGTRRTRGARRTHRLPGDPA